MKRYNPLSDFLQKKFAKRTFRVSLNPGFTCPNRDGTKGTGGCTYCNVSSLLIPDYTGMSIGGQLERGISYLRERRRAERFIAYFQPNTNTYAPVEVLERLFTEAIEHPDVAALAVSTRPDCLGEGVLDLLTRLSSKKYLWIELGLQSSQDHTLRSINRGHTVADFLSAHKDVSDRHIPVCAHVILGLPGETTGDILDTARFLAELGVWGIKLHPLHILRGTKMESLYRNGAVRPLGLEEYADTVVSFLEHTPQETIIHRLCGSTPKRFLIAPEWGWNRFSPPAYIRRLLDARDTHQGAKR